MKPLKVIRHNNTKGFTLIELLISISILSLLLFTGSYSYSLLSNRWNKELGHFSESVEKVKHQQYLQSLLTGVQAFVITDKNKRPSFFFVGDKTSLLAVSNGGIFDDKFPVVFRITAIEKAEGLFDLVYQSVSTKNILLLYSEQEIEFTNELILFENLTSISFSYLGVPSSVSSEDKLPAIWTEKFSGIDSQSIPIQLSVLLTNESGSYTFPVYLEHESEIKLSTYYDDV